MTKRFTHLFGSALPVLAMASLAAYVTPAQAQGIAVDNCLYGSVVASEDWDMENQGPLYGLYAYDGVRLDSLLTDPYLEANGGGTYVDGLFCYNFNFSMMGQMVMNLYLKYNFETDRIEGYELFETEYTDIATQVAYDATTGLVYGQFHNRDRSALVWGTRDIEEGFTTAINPVMDCTALRALAFDNLGRAWAVDEGGDLLQIDKVTGQISKVGNLGLQLSASPYQSGAIDPTSGTFYMVAVLGDNTSHLISIDLATGAATKLTDMPGNAQMTAAYFLPLEYADAVPAAASELQASFADAALQGTVSFVAPATDESGAPLIEGATATLTLDGVAIYTTATTPGQTISTEVTISEPGTHIFQVICSNATGQGRPVTAQRWIGLDAPVAVTALSASNIDNTHALLSWQAPATGLHGGYIDPAHLNYNIYSSDGTVVAEGITDNQYEVSRSSSRLAARTFTVVAFSDNVEGLSAESNRIYFGNRYKIPYSTYFDTEAEADLWYVVDANDDGSTWTYDAYNRYMRYNYNKYFAADDWLFSPPIHLNAGSYYDITSNMAAEMTYYQERFEILLCSAQRPDAAVCQIRPATETVKNTKEERAFFKYEDTFTVPADGDYYIAYHCISSANQLRLEVRNIEITAGALLEAPAAASNVEFAAGASGSPTAHAHFDAPTQNIKGETLTSLTKAELYNGSVLCATLTDIEPGKHYTISDDHPTSGYNTYRLLIYNEYGKGLPVEGTVYVGVDRPASPTNVHIELMGNGVYMSWDPVTIGMHGGYVNPDGINYVACRQSDVEVVYSGNGLECVDNSVVNSGSQRTEYYGIFAYYGTEPSPGAATSDVILGTPYKMPFRETFAPGTGSTTLWLIGYDPEHTSASWSSESLPSSDSNPGNLMCTAWYDDQECHHFLSSGKINVKSSAPAPVLTFQYMANDVADRIELVVSTIGVPNSGEVVATYRSENPGQWEQAVYNLRDFKGDNVIFTWHCYLAKGGSIVLDDICVEDNEELAIEQLHADDDAASHIHYDIQGRRVSRDQMRGIVLSKSSRVYIK